MIIQLFDFERLQSLLLCQQPGRIKGKGDTGRRKGQCDGLYFLLIFPNHPAWISISNHITRNILCNNTASSDYHIISNGNAWHDNRPSAYPYIVSDHNGSCLCFAKFKRPVFLRRSKTVNCICRMKGRVNLDIGSD